MDSKCDEYEYCVNNFLEDILRLAGIEDENPTFTRSMIVNKGEEITNVLQAAQYTGEEYTTTKLLNILGDGDMVEEILQRKDEEDMERFTSRKKNANNDSDEEDGDSNKSSSEELEEE